MLLLWLRGEWHEAVELCRSVSLDLEERAAAILAQALHGAECDILIDRGAVYKAARSPARSRASPGT